MILESFGAFASKGPVTQTQPCCRAKRWNLDSLVLVHLLWWPFWIFYVVVPAIFEIGMHKKPWAKFSCFFPEVYTPFTYPAHCIDFKTLLLLQFLCRLEPNFIINKVVTREYKVFVDLPTVPIFWHFESFKDWCQYEDPKICIVLKMAGMKVQNWWNFGTSGRRSYICTIPFIVHMSYSPSSGWNHLVHFGKFLMWRFSKGYCSHSFHPFSVQLSGRYGN